MMGDLGQANSGDEAKHDLEFAELQMAGGHPEEAAVECK